MDKPRRGSMKHICEEELDNLRMSVTWGKMVNAVYSEAMEGS